jgi:hypothetical protein
MGIKKLPQVAHKKRHNWPKRVDERLRSDTPEAFADELLFSRLSTKLGGIVRDKQPDCRFDYFHDVNKPPFFKHGNYLP